MYQASVVFLARERTGDMCSNYLLSPLPSASAIWDFSRSDPVDYSSAYIAENYVLHRTLFNLFLGRVATMLVSPAAEGGKMA